MSHDVIKTFTGNIEAGDHPYLQGPWAPLHEEVNADDLIVLEGTVPDDIDGVYLRNTQNPLHQALSRYHPFDGDGMIHMAAFRDGKVQYRNRYIETKGLQAEIESGERLWAGLMEAPSLSKRPGWGAHGAMKDASSTDVVVHAGKALTTYFQCGEGYRLDPLTLAQAGVPEWSPEDGISAHTKVDEQTGELLFFNYSKKPPYMHYGVVDRNDQLVHYTPIPLPGPRLPHDMAYTQNYAILNDFPLYWDPEALKQDKHVVRFYKDQPSRFAVIPRRGGVDDIMWFEAAPTFVLHWLNAYEEGDEIVLDGYFQEDPMPTNYEGALPGYERMMSYLDQFKMGTKLHRWRFNLKTGKTTEQRLDDRIMEFGMFNQKYAGRPYRYAYSALQVPGWFIFNGYLKTDLHTGESWEIRLPEGQFASEAPFAPRINAKDEDDGYLVTFIINETTGKSEVALIDCKRFSDGPICRVQLPHQMASGTHSCWANGVDFRDGGILARAAMGG
ncbi:carotenoid oxygenase family protein [Pararhodobacter zhoushanensis]|uniref:carotenoid oxygenase family protein n=1 Tax=Pararhodobacter zhoushanensis TaxID=2479545 RepID=UPI000F8F5E40|nr:carotenoid oxygenase family protein [Pararhodobacter zhoushanensis]